MKNQNYILFKFLVIFTLLFGTRGFSFAQNIPVDMSGKKIEWMIERKTLTRAEMQAILDKPASERYIRLKVMIKLPSNFGSTFLGSSMFDYTIFDPVTNTPSTVVAHHIAQISAEPGLYFAAAFRAVKSGSPQSGSLSVVPGLETEPCGGIGFGLAANTAEMHIIADGVTFDTLFEIPFFINAVGAFDVCFGPCLVSGCADYNSLPAGQKCPGTYGIIANFLQAWTGLNVQNQTSGHNDFFKGNNGLYEPLVNGENTYNKVICGGVTLLEGPETELAMLDTACPETDFIFTATTKSVDPITNFKVQYKHTTGSWTDFSAGVDYLLNMVSNTNILKEAEVTIYAAAMNRTSSWHNTQVRVISENANGKDTTTLTTNGTTAVIRVPELPKIKIQLIGNPSMNIIGDAVLQIA